MRLKSARFLCLALTLLPPIGYAQMAVIDVQALNSLKQQLNAWQNQINLMQSQIHQTDMILQNQSGNRGYAGLLRAPNSALNYLPPTWPSASEKNAPLATDQTIQTILGNNAVLTPQQLTTLATTSAALTQQYRLMNAQSQSFSQQAYVQSSARISRINSMIDQISTTHDPQSSAELQARLQGEQLLLLNELVKLLSVLINTNSDRNAIDQNAREQSINQHGDIANRFHPKPAGG